MIKPASALILVDLQNDFCEGGNLGVDGAHQIMPLANQLMNKFKLVVASKDWHPQDHVSFASNHSGKQVGDKISLNGGTQILWPDHCVQDTHGAEFHPDLNVAPIKKLFLKGTDKNIDSYSAFFDNRHARDTGLVDYLKQGGVTDVYIMGLTIEYCVMFTILDALNSGFNVYMIEDACCGVELEPGHIDQAMTEIGAAGANIIQSKDIISI
jgi:nicotinamidase/pyrazinamidase